MKAETYKKILDGAIARHDKKQEVQYIDIEIEGFDYDEQRGGYYPVYIVEDTEALEGIEFEALLNCVHGEVKIDLNSVAYYDEDGINGARTGAGMDADEKARIEMALERYLNWRF